MGGAFNQNFIVSASVTRPGEGRTLPQAAATRESMAMKKNKKHIWFAIACVCAIAAARPAGAADMGEPNQDDARDDSVVTIHGNWSGPYIGGNVGATWTNGSADMWASHGGGAPGILATTHVHKDLGGAAAAGGIHAGNNWQNGALVVGLEGDANFGGNVDYLASIRGRLGFVANNWLFFGTGGVGFVGQSSSGYLEDGYSAKLHYDVNGDSVGYVVGGGVEVKLNNAWSVGAEGLYYGFDNPAYAHKDAGGSEINADAGSNLAVVRGRLSYHLNRGPEPLK
jgi:outer membrane immunogenic protein